MQGYHTPSSVETSSLGFDRRDSLDDSFIETVSPNGCRRLRSHTCSLRPVHLSPGSRPFGIGATDYDTVVDIARRSIDGGEMTFPDEFSSKEELLGISVLEEEGKEMDAEEGLSPFFGADHGCKPPPTTPIHSLFPRTDSADRVDFDGDAMMEKPRKTSPMDGGTAEFRRPASIGVFEDLSARSPQPFCQGWEEKTHISYEEGEETGEE
jgi:hypothetical protein